MSKIDVIFHSQDIFSSFLTFGVRYAEFMVNLNVVAGKLSVTEQLCAVDAVGTLHVSYVLVSNAAAPGILEA